MGCLICFCGMKMVRPSFMSAPPSRTNARRAAGTAKLVEVKGPRDRLSAYQQVWIDQLLAAGVECELCYVLEYQEPVLNHKRKLPH
jgi:hypothetical protein